MKKDCTTCAAYLGGGMCRDNLEHECAAGGGYEAWREKQPVSDASRENTLPERREDNGIRYILTLTEDQQRTVARACEFYARVMTGQFGEISYEAMMNGLSKLDFRFDREIADEILFAARKIIFPDLQGRGHSYGIGHDAATDRAFGVYEVLRHARAWHEHPEGGMTVDFHTPMAISGEPLPKCEVRVDLTSTQQSGRKNR